VKFDFSVGANLPHQIASDLQFGEYILSYLTGWIRTYIWAQVFHTNRLLSILLMT